MDGVFVGRQDSREPNIDYDRANEELSRNLIRKSPARGIAYAQRIINEDYRNKTLDFMGRVWARRDPADAVAWFEENAETLPEGTKEVLGPIFLAAP